MAGVERNVGRSRFQEREKRHIGFDAALEHDRDAVAWLHPARLQESRRLVRPRVELAEGDVDAFGRHRDAVGVETASLLENVAQPLAVAPAKRSGFGKHRRRPRRLRPAEVGQEIVFERRLAQIERGGVHENARCLLFDREARWRERGLRFGPDTVESPPRT
ncbi:MAG TPA: hypothetical protein VFE63_02700 [Roseiarcus sp.]|nr:hypothetical protein [Roseiarcus sp.]